jgi:hypothetical protein
MRSSIRLLACDNFGLESPTPMQVPDDLLESSSLRSSVNDDCGVAETKLSSSVSEATELIWSRYGLDL